MGPREEGVKGDNRLSPLETQEAADGDARGGESARDASTKGSTRGP